MTFREAIEQTQELADWANAPRVDDLIPASWLYYPFESQAMHTGIYARAWLVSPAAEWRIAIDVTPIDKERNPGQAFALIRAKIECAVLSLEDAGAKA